MGMSDSYPPCENKEFMSLSQRIIWAAIMNVVHLMGVCNKVRKRISGNQIFSYLCCEKLLTLMAIYKDVDRFRQEVKDPKQMTIALNKKYATGGDILFIKLDMEWCNINVHVKTDCLYVPIVSVLKKELKYYGLVSWEVVIKQKNWLGLWNSKFNFFI